MPFTDLGLIEPLRRALVAEGYESPTPIQERAIPRVLEGRDLLGGAQTGTGKTAAFSLPLLQRLSATKPHSAAVRALVLSPTRELAAQIGERIAAYGKHLGLRHVVIYGGVSQMHQERALRPVPPIVVATPGRLLDLCSQKLVDLSKVEILVLDEADRMLDMGFIHDVRRIVGMTPSSRQTLLFSATLPKEIVALAKSILKDPVRVDVAPEAKTADTVEQSVYFVAKPHKRALLEHLLKDPAIERALVFTRTKHGANRIATQLGRAHIQAGAIHGDKTQGARERALSDFKRGTTRVLVATDIAARGIDVDGVSHVVNFDLPMEAESYVHRIGRTGRAGAQGLAFSFCDEEEKPLLTSIEKLIGSRIRVVAEHPLSSAPVPVAPPPPPRGQPRHGARPQRSAHAHGKPSSSHHGQPRRAQPAGAPQLPHPGQAQPPKRPHDGEPRAARPEGAAGAGGRNRRRRGRRPFSNPGSGPKNG